jgi:hypothetical protein
MLIQMMFDFIKVDFTGKSLQGLDQGGLMLAVEDFGVELRQFGCIQAI